MKPIRLGAVKSPGRFRCPSKGPPVHINRSNSILVTTLGICV